MDIKLGTDLYDIDANEEKKARMIEKARKGTSLETGLRLSGIQVYDHTKQTLQPAPREYGRSLKPPQLPEAIARFFPLSSADDQAAGEGLPSRLLIPVIRGIMVEIQKIKHALEQLDYTMIGSSLLIIYEADWDRSAQGLEYLFQNPAVDEDEEEESGGEEEETTEEVDRSKPGPPYRVRLIDFAHTRLLPGHGPDQRMLKGIDSLLALLEGRITEISGA